MSQRYVFVRMPKDTYEKYFNVKIKLQQNIRQITGKKIAIPMTKVFGAVVSEEIEVDLKKLLRSK